MSLIIPGRVIKIIKGKAIPKTEPNQNTDDMVYGEFLNKVSFKEMAKFLYFKERMRNGKPVPDHPFNNPAYNGANILLGGENFGCGSSREHAPQAFKKYGIQAIVAGDYAGIFGANCAEVGVVAVTAPMAEIREMAERVKRNPSLELFIDLEKKEVKYGEKNVVLGIAESVRQSFLTGTWDTLALLQHNQAEVEKSLRKLPYFGLN